MISEEQLQEIRNRAEKASGSPWYGEYYDDVEFIGIINEDNDVLFASISHGLDVSVNDFEFILNARQDIPALLEEIERLKALNNKEESA